MTSNFRLKFNNLAPFEKTGRDVMVQGMPLDAWDEFSKTILVRYVLFHVSSTLYLDPGLGGGRDEVWDRETMFSQLAKRSPRVVVSG